jgi:hypothetical protein
VGVPNSWDKLELATEGASIEKDGCSESVPELGPPNEKAGWAELELAAAGEPDWKAGWGALEAGAPNRKTGCGEPSSAAGAPAEQAGCGVLPAAASAPNENGGKLELAAAGVGTE